MCEGEFLWQHIAIIGLNLVIILTNLLLYRVMEKNAK